jgi:xylitol oxidase
MVERNWAGNIEFGAATIVRPTSVVELRQVILRAQHCRVLGTRHSFNHIADSPELVSLEALPDDVVVDPTARTVELNPAMTYGRLAPLLHDHRLALHNLASLPHISIGGAIATGTHGSGDRLGNLATAVSALDIMRADGQIVRLVRGDADFDGAVVALGALGVVVRIRLDLEPEYHVDQRVFVRLAWDEFVAHFDEITRAGDSVSCFTTWGSDVEQVWIKRRLPHDADAASAAADGAAVDSTAVDLYDARPAAVDLHPIAGVSGEHCTPQLGVAGLWSDRLPHFKMGFTPSSGDELQSELLLPRTAAVDAIEIVRAFGAAMAPHLLVSEIRTVAADSLWMSPQYERDTVAIHFTWRPHHAAVIDLVARLESALASFDARPHWGKLFTCDVTSIASCYPRHRDFVELVQGFDPRRVFRNDWLTRHVVG